MPTPDSYTWLISAKENFAEFQIDESYHTNRWGFMSLVAITHFTTELPLFFIYKYLFVFFPLLALTPLWLIARRLPSRFAQTLILATIFISPTVAIEFEYIRNQIIFLYFMFLSIALLMHAKHKKDSFIFYLVGIYTFLGSFYHPLFSIFTIIWLLSALIKNTKYLWKHKILAVTLLLLLGLNIKTIRIDIMLQAIKSILLSGIERIISHDWNWAFPAIYDNADGFEMGWPGFTGVAKYYSFYAGPAIFSIVALLIILLIIKKKFRKTLLKELISADHLPILLLLFFFFGISEVAPRLMGISYLPDRSWQYLGISLIFFLFLILKYFSENKKVTMIVSSTLLFAFVINAAGAGYISYLTGYTMPDYEMRAAKWIENNTPENSIIFSVASKNIIKYHSNRIRRPFDKSTLLEVNIENALTDIAYDYDFLSQGTIEHIKFARYFTEKVHDDTEWLLNSLETNIATGNVSATLIESYIEKSLSLIDTSEIVLIKYRRAQYMYKHFFIGRNE